MMRNYLYPPGQGLEALCSSTWSALEGFVSLHVERECVERMGQQRISLGVLAVLGAKVVKHL